MQVTLEAVQWQRRRRAPGRPLQGPVVCGEEVAGMPRCWGWGQPSRLLPVLGWVCDKKDYQPLWEDSWSQHCSSEPHGRFQSSLFVFILQQLEKCFSLGEKMLTILM